MPSSPLRRKLRGAGHHLFAIVQVGKEGVTDAVLRQLQQALHDHELVKVKLGTESPDDRFEAAERLSTGAEAQLAQVLGRTLLVYKKHPDRPRYEPLPAGTRVPPRSAPPRPAKRPSKGRTSGGRPTAGRRAGAEGPSTGRPATGRPGSGRPATGRPATGRPTSGRPATGNRPAAGRPSTGRPSTGRPATGRRPAAGRSTSRRPAPRGPARTRR